MIYRFPMGPFWEMVDSFVAGGQLMMRKLLIQRPLLRMTVYYLMAVHAEQLLPFPGWSLGTGE
jgi:hypothetical protein